MKNLFRNIRIWLLKLRFEGATVNIGKVKWGCIVKYEDKSYFLNYSIAKKNWLLKCFYDYNTKEWHIRTIFNPNIKVTIQKITEI